MDPAWLTFAGVVVVALSGVTGTLGASWISRRAGERAQENARRKIDREEFDSLTRELRASLRDVRRDLDAERQARVEAETRASSAEQRATSADERATTAERRVAQLERRVAELEAR